MSYIKKFIDKIATLDSRQAREVILPMSEAKQLRDEISKLLVDQVNQTSEEKIEVVMNGGKC
jgi:hypothetical protein